MVSVRATHDVTAGDPSLEEVLSEAGVAIQHQCEPDSAATPGL